MIITCAQCRTRFKISDEKITEKGVKVRCARCGNTFRVSPGSATQETQGAEAFTDDPFAQFGAGGAGESPFGAPATPRASAPSGVHLNPLAAEGFPPDRPSASPMGGLGDRSRTDVVAPLPSAPSPGSLSFGVTAYSVAEAPTPFDFSTLSPPGDTKKAIGFGAATVARAPKTSAPFDFSTLSPAVGSGADDSARARARDGSSVLDFSAPAPTEGETQAPGAPSTANGSFDFSALEPLRGTAESFDAPLLPAAAGPAPEWPALGGAEGQGHSLGVGAGFVVGSIEPTMDAAPGFLAGWQAAASESARDRSSSEFDAPIGAGYLPGRERTALSQTPPSGVRQPVPGPDARGALFDLSGVAGGVAPALTLPDIPAPEAQEVLDSMRGPAPSLTLPVSETPLSEPVFDPERAALGSLAEAQRPRRGILSAFMNFGLALMVLFLLLVVTSVFINDGQLELNSLSSDRVKAALSGGSGFVAYGISNGLYETVAGRPVFFVRGEVTNMGASAARVKVRAEIVEGGALVRAVEGYAGVPLTPEQLRNLTSADDLNQLLARQLTAARRLGPGERAPFTVAFFEYPPDLKTFRVRVEASPLGVDSGAIEERPTL